jgi:hypothetical protein
MVQRVQRLKVRMDEMKVIQLAVRSKKWQKNTDF